MAIGRFRDRPEEMDETERAVTAAQYPEGGLVAGMGLGICLPLVLALAPALVALGPIAGGVAGFAVGRWVRRRKLAAFRATQDRE